MSMIPLHTVKLKPADRRALDRKMADHTVPLHMIAEWLAGRGYRVDRAALRRYGIFTGLRRMGESRFLRVDRVLAEADRPAYEALIGNPQTTAAEAAAWLKARGYPHVGQGAIGIHRRRFLDKLDGVRHTARFSRSIVEVARENGQAAMSDGMLTRFEQVLLEQLVRLQEHEKIETKDLAELGKCVAAAVGSRERLEEVRREYERAKRAAAEAGQAAARSGATPQQVADRMREILGI